MPTPSSSPLARLAEGPLGRLAAGTAELRRAFEAGAPGIDLARRRAHLMDEVLVEIFAAAELPSGWSLVALGGYGRTELAPYSDIDLMVLHSGRAQARAAKVAEHVFYPLWDAGLAVGNAVRTVKQALAVGAESLETQTSLLDGRLLAGDPTLLDELTLLLRRQIRAGDGRPFFEGVRAELARRHDEFGRSAYLLEPHVKEGLGGLRDIQAITWVGKGLLDCSDVAALAAKGHVTRADEATLSRAYAFLVEIRTRLHQAAGRQDDRLTFDHQIALAEALGYVDEQDGRATERFMTEVFEHTGQVERVSAVFWEQQAARRRPYSDRTRKLTDHLAVRNGHVHLTPPSALAERPATILELFEASVRQKVPVAAEAIQAVQEALPDLPPPEWEDAARRALVGLLDAGSKALPTLELLTQLGVLTYFIPEWDNIRSRVQFDAYHLYTVDLHALHTVAEMGRLRDGKHSADEPLATELMKALQHREPLLLAGLLHDLGKGLGQGHAERGADLAMPIVARMGLPEQTAGEIVYLVRNHLLLYDTATRRDLNDENVVVSVAQDVKTPDRLRQLYLLTVCDAIATGPKAWNPWKSALVGELTVKAMHILERGEYATKDGRLHLAEVERDVLAILTPRHSVRTVDEFLESMPYSYLLAHEADDICRHYELMSETSARALRTALRRGKRRGLYEFTVVTKDEPDLFPTAAGALALSGITIHGAETYVRSNGQALMVFAVADAFDATVPKTKWAKVEEDIASALDGRIALVWRLADRAERYKGLSAPGRPTKPRIIVDDSASDFYTVVEVYATDRVGLLFTITSALRELRLTVHQARISTAGDEAADVFYVLDRYGLKVSDAKQIDEVSRALEYALTR